MSTTLCAERPYAIGDVIVELQGASWSLDHASGAFCILTQSASIRLQAACIESYNAVYVGPFVDAVIATKKIEQGSPIALFTCLVGYHFHQVVPCPCGCGRMLKGFSGLSDTEKQALTFLTEPDVRRAAYADGYVVQTSKKDLIEARPNGEMGLAMYALQPILKGTELFQCGGLLVPRATMYTIQVAQNKHSLFGDGAECIAHSCDPNVVVVPHPNPSHTEAFVFVAYRDIQAGELLGFNYQSTEWLMQQAFTCLCGSKECFGTIGGFSNATEEQRSRMWPYATNVMKNLVSPPKLN